MKVILVVLDALSVLTALGAAFLWYRSAIVKTPINFTSYTVQVPTAFGSTVGVGGSPNLEVLGRALQRQSRLSAWAALCAAASAASQAIAFMIRSIT